MLKRFDAKFSNEEKDEVKQSDIEDNLKEKQQTPLAPIETDHSRGFNSALLNSFNEISQNLERVMKSYNNTITAMIFSESRFADWTREEMIDRLIYDGIEIRDERNIREADLERFCDEYYAKKDVPPKIEPFSAGELRSIERAVRVLQNAFIYRKYKARNVQLRQEYLQENSLPERDFLFTDYTTGGDFGDMEALYDEENPVNRNSFEFSNPHAHGSSNLSLSPKSRSKKRNVTSINQFMSTQAGRKILSLLETPWSAPDWAMAKKSMDYTHPRLGGKGGAPFNFKTTTTGRHCCIGGMGEQCDLWKEGQISEFSIYGSGITNYFKFIKWLIWVFLIVSVLTFPLLLINTYGASTAHLGPGDLAVLSVGNLVASYINGTLSIPIASCDPAVIGGQSCTINRTTLGYLYSYGDIVVCVFVLVAFAWLRAFENIEESNLNRNTVYTSLFSVEIKNLPSDCNDAELFTHFQALTKNQTPIVDIDFGFDNDAEIEICKERGEFMRLKTRLINEYRYKCHKLQQNKDLVESPELEVRKYLKEFFDACRLLDFGIKAFDTSLKNLDSRQDKPKVAYLIFNDPMGAAMVLDMYQPTILDLFFRDERLYFKGKKLKVKPAPEPSTIIWENLAVSRWNRLGRRGLTTLMALIFSTLSVALIYGTKSLVNDYQSDGGSGSCTKFSSISNQRQYVIDNPNYLHCYCDQLSETDQSTDSVCRTYYQKQVYADLLSFVASSLIVIINVLISYVMRALARFERHHSTDSQERSVFTRVFLLKYINSSFVFLATSTNPSDYANYFNADWYPTIGATIIIVQLFNILGGHIETFLQYFWYHYQLSTAKRDPSVCLTQAELNKVHIGPEFFMATRYAQLLSTFFVCLTFSTGMPFLYIVMTFNFLTFYFIEKYLFINLYRIPQRFNPKLGKSATFWIPIGIVLHLVMSIWVLSNINVFSPDHESQAYQGDDAVRIRISYIQTFPVFVFFVCVVVGFVILILADYTSILLKKFTYYLKGDVERKIWIKEQLEEVNRSGPNINGGFVRALQRNVIKDLASYNILRNPKYQEEFALPSLFTLQHKRVRSIRFQTLGPVRHDGEEAANEIARRTVSSVHNSRTERASQMILPEDAFAPSTPSSPNNRASRRISGHPSTHSESGFNSTASTSDQIRRFSARDPNRSGNINASLSSNISTSTSQRRTSSNLNINTNSSVYSLELPPRSGAQPQSQPQQMTVDQIRSSFLSSPTGRPTSTSRTSQLSPVHQQQQPRDDRAAWDNSGAVNNTSTSRSSTAVPIRPSFSSPNLHRDNFVSTPNSTRPSLYQPQSPSIRRKSATEASTSGLIGFHSPPITPTSRSAIFNPMGRQIVNNVSDNTQAQSRREWEFSNTPTPLAYPAPTTPANNRHLMEEGMFVRNSQIRAADVVHAVPVAEVWSPPPASAQRRSLSLNSPPVDRNVFTGMNSPATRR